MGLANYYDWLIDWLVSA